MSQAGINNVESSDPQIPIIFQTDSGNATAFLNTIEILGGIDASTSATGNVITINSNAGGFTWQVVTSADNPVELVSGHGYITKGIAQVVFTLPPAASVGHVYRIAGYSNLWKITQNANQSITIGVKTTLPGVAGSITATSVSDGIELLCMTANLEFYEMTMQGNVTVV